MFGNKKLAHAIIFLGCLLSALTLRAGFYVSGGVGGNGATVEYRQEGTPENTPYGGVYFMGQLGAGYAFAAENFSGRLDLGAEWQNMRTRDRLTFEMGSEPPRVTDVETRIDYDLYFQFRPGIRLGKAYTAYGILGAVWAPIENKNSSVNVDDADFHRQNEWAYRLGFGAAGSFEKDFMKGWGWSLEYTYTGFPEISQTLTDIYGVDYTFKEKVAFNQVVFALSYAFW